MFKHSFPASPLPSSCPQSKKVNERVKSREGAPSLDVSRKFKAYKVGALPGTLPVAPPLNHSENPSLHLSLWSGHLRLVWVSALLTQESLIIWVISLSTLSLCMCDVLSLHIKTNFGFTGTQPMPSTGSNKTAELGSAGLNMPTNLENSAVAPGLEKISFHSSPKERQC